MLPSSQYFAQVYSCVPFIVELHGNLKRCANWMWVVYCVMGRGSRDKTSFRASNESWIVAHILVSRRLRCSRGIQESVFNYPELVKFSYKNLDKTEGLGYHDTSLVSWWASHTDSEWVFIIWRTICTYYVIRDHQHTNRIHETDVQKETTRLLGKQSTVKPHVYSIWVHKSLVGAYTIKHLFLHEIYFALHYWFVIPSSLTCYSLYVRPHLLIS